MARKKKIDPIEEQAADEAPGGYYNPNKIGSFNVLASDDFTGQVHESLTAMKERRKNRPTGFRTAAEIQRSMIPVRDFRMQYVLGTRGLPQGTVIEIIGAEHIGKSTLLYWLGGGAMLAGCPFAIQETEGKPLLPDWAIRAMHRDRATATRMMKAMTVFPNVFALDQFEENLKDWCQVMRDKVGVPMDTPLLMGVDTYSKMMNPSEAAGVLDYGDYMDADSKKAYKATNEGSTFVHAKWSQAFCRRLPSLLSQYNVVLINNCHQNDKVNTTSGGKASFMSEDTKAKYNKTKIGGRSFNQNSALQVILTPAGSLKDSGGQNIGQRVNLRVDKNSYGPKDRELQYGIKNKEHHDTDTFVDPSIRFEQDLAVWMATEKLLGTTATRARYTSDELAIVNATAEEFSDALHANTTAMEKLGKELKIHGYYSAVDMV